MDFESFKKAMTTPDDKAELVFIEHDDDIDLTLYQKRIRICGKCPYKTKVGICSKCGCVLAIKARFSVFACPIGNW